MPLVIFLTAYDQHAIEAFRHSALDYLLKPIDAERFREALDKARRQLMRNKLAEHGAKLKDLLAQLDQGSAGQEGADGTHRITVKTSGRVYFLKPVDIHWVEAEGDYVTIHTAERTHLVRETLQAMEEKLSPHGFQRIHRRAIVNLDQIRELAATGTGEQEVRLADGATLKLGRNYRDALYARMKISS